VPELWLKAFWGFNPENEGYLGFTLPGNRANFLSEAKSGDHVLIYGSTDMRTPGHQRRQLLGILEVDTVPVASVDRMSAEARQRQVQNRLEGRWQYAVPARRAWRINQRYSVREIFPRTYIRDNVRVLGTQGVKVDPEETEGIAGLSLTQVNVFGEPEIAGLDGRAITYQRILAPSRGLTPVFGPRTTVYEDGEHYLYIMVADGPINAILGLSPEQTFSKCLLKIGFSNNPARRCAEHNATLPPASQFKWRLDTQSTPFADGESAKVAEDELKELLASSLQSLGGEFFLGKLNEAYRALYAVRGAGNRIRPPSSPARRHR